MNNCIHSMLVILLAGGMAIAQKKNHYQEKPKRKEAHMSVPEKNKEVIRKLYEQALNKRNFEMLRDLIDENFVGPEGEKGPEGFAGPVNMLISAFPDVQWKIEQLMAEGDNVMVKWKVEGTHTAPFRFIPPTGNRFSNDGIGIYTLRNGKAVRAQIHTDRLGFLQELEVLPADLTPLMKRQSNDCVYFIDKFLVPAPAKKEFYERMQISRDVIRTVSGFIEDAAYEYTDKDGNLVCITVATWENREALSNAREIVQKKYQEQGFDPAEMMKRLNITMDRGIYTRREKP